MAQADDPLFQWGVNVCVLCGPLPELLYHYTDSAALQGILESSTLWATAIRNLNDETEVKYSRDPLRTLAERLRQEFGGDWAAKVACDALTAMATSGTFPTRSSLLFVTNFNETALTRGPSLSLTRTALCASWTSNLTTQPALK